MPSAERAKAVGAATVDSSESNYQGTTAVALADCSCLLVGLFYFSFFLDLSFFFGSKNRGKGTRC
jgi:hypothetical protein